jgi:DNA-binding MarR family transcriptional regulator
VSSIPPGPDRDLALIFTALSATLDERIRSAVAAAGYADVRVSHGYVFQHLVEGPATVGELAGKLGMTHQAASKSLAELERLGYVQRDRRPGDARIRRVELTMRAHGAIEAARTARRELNAELRGLLDPASEATLDTALERLTAHTDALDALLSRRLRPAR